MNLKIREIVQRDGDQNDGARVEYLLSEYCVVDEGI